MTEHRDLEVGGTTVHLRRTGSGMPLLLLHGVTDSGAVWDRVTGALADRFDVVAPDARGHGRSSRIGEAFAIEALAEDAAAVVRSEFGGPVAVWGHSMGAATAEALAATHPDLVTRVVLEDPPFTGRAPEGEGDVGTDDVLDGIRRTVREVRDADDPIAFARAANPDWDDAELPGWVESKVDFDEAVLARRIVDSDWRALASRIAAPVLLLTGDPARGAIVTEAAAAEFVSLRPGTRVRRFDGAGHNVHREAYDGVLAAVREFLVQPS